MRRSGMWFTGIALAIAGAVIGLLAYNAGYSHGLAHGGTTVQVVRDTGFPFLIFPLFFVLFFVMRLVFWSRWRRGQWMHGPHGHAHLEDWHHAHGDEERAPR